MGNDNHLGRKPGPLHADENSVGNAHPERSLHFQILRSDAGCHWQLRGANGEIMASSEVLTTKLAAQDAILTTQRLAASATVDDRS
jgi:uncharacterized protein YegP (UPF0339 family)